MGLSLWPRLFFRPARVFIEKHHDKKEKLNKNKLRSRARPAVRADLEHPKVKLRCRDIGSLGLEGFGTALRLEPHSSRFGGQTNYNFK